jgi:hypothetical protein
MMLGVRWSHALLALPFIAFYILFGSYKQYGILLFLFGRAFWPYSNLTVSHASFITILLITYLMLYLLQGSTLPNNNIGWNLRSIMFFA